MAGALIGALRVSLSAETSSFEAGMRRSQKTAQKTSSAIKNSFNQIKGDFFGSAIKGFIGAITVGSFVQITRNALEYAGSLGEVSQQLGVTTRDLQVLRFAAGQVGISQEELETGLQKLTITLGKVAAGAEAPIKALKAIGISASELKGKDAGQALRIIADALQNVTDRSQRAAIEVALFGKSGAKLDNLLSGGSRAINNLEAAADKLGIVLSDEQIQNADDTADKLAALQTVLQARIAGVVADNSKSILALADALVDVGSAVAGSFGALARMFNFINANAPIVTQSLLAATSSLNTFANLVSSFGGNNGNVIGFGKAGSSVTVPLGPAIPKIKPRDIDPFLASGGGKPKKAKADHSAEKALRDANQFDQDIRRANIDILNAKRDLATDAVEQYAISIQIKDAEKAAFEAQLAYEVQLNQLTKGQEGITAAQAGQLKAQNDIKDDLERQKLIRDENHRALEDSNKLDDLQFDLERDRLQSEQQLAETASEQRDVQLRLLDLAYRQERARLQTIIADEKATDAAKEEARRRLLNLNRTYSNDRAGVIANTRGPMEDWLASLPTTAAKADEALQRLQVQGFEGLIDAALQLSEGFDSAKDALLNTLKQFLLGIARIELQKAFGGFLQGGNGLGGLFSSLLGGSSSAGRFGGNSLGGGLAGLAGFASGGLVKVLGRSGVDRNIVSINGIPQFRVSYGERLGISNDNHAGMRAGRAGIGNAEIHFHGISDFGGFQRNKTQVARQAKRDLGIAS